MACGGSQQRSSQALMDDGVPANSASEKRLESSNPTPTAKASPEPSGDPTQPYVQPVSGAGATTEGPTGKPANGKGAAAKTGKGKGNAAADTITPAECNKLFDRYVELTFLTDPRFDGIPPEMLAQLKGQGFAQADKEKGNPCGKEAVARTKYDCAMAATHPKVWEGCMR